MVNWLLGFAWYSFGAFMILACIAAIARILIEAASSPEVVDDNIRWEPTAHGHETAEHDHYERED